MVACHVQFYDDPVRYRPRHAPRMQVVKRAGAVLQVRVPVAKSVREWAVRVEGMEPDVAAIQAQERDEMELRRAEMQANKVRSCLPPGWLTVHGINKDRGFHQAQMRVRCTSLPTINQSNDVLVTALGYARPASE